MQITMVPQFSMDGSETVLSVSGTVLTVDGVDYDLAANPEPGGPFLGAATVVDDAIHCTLIVQLGLTAAPDQTGDPWIVDAADGAVTIPAARVEGEDVEGEPAV